MKLRLFIPVLCLTGFVSLAAEEPVSFRNDVMAVLSKAGCNSGPCHGNAKGKAGFKLSLFGDDPTADYETLVYEVFGRRINPSHPDQSLVLLKATTEIPHEGGRRFENDSVEYEILHDWIKSRAQVDGTNAPTLVSISVTPEDSILENPENELPLTAIATFSDGSSRDVTRLAKFEPANPLVNVTREGVVESDMPAETTVMVRYLNLHEPVRVTFIDPPADFKWSPPPPLNYIDEQVDRKLKALKMNPSPVIDDGEFIRRASLDLLGILPTAAEARAFVASKDRNKRAALVDQLLERTEFAEHWALKWADLLRLEEKVLDRKGVELFHRWIRESLAENKPLDQFVREIITARGSTYQNPPANFYRSTRTPIKRSETAAQVFLGTRLQCAQCHNHPFDKWSQNDYYDWAGLFARIDYKVLENRRRDGLDKNAFIGEQIIYTRTQGEVRNPGANKNAVPRFLGESDTVSRNANRLVELANWMTRPENPLFARVQVNRIWYHLMGRGIVDPIDDFRSTNLPSHPKLLHELTYDFVSNGFDLRHIIRTIMQSRAYQTSALPNESNEFDTINYSHAQVRRLDAEQILDAMSQVTGSPLTFKGYPEGMRAGQIPGVRAVPMRYGAPTAGDQFLVVFGKPERHLATEEERSCNTNLGQAFQLMTGPAMNDLLARSGNRIDQLLNSEKSNTGMIEELYWTALTRPPTETESQALTSHIENHLNKRAALEDITWALVNSKEFVMRH